MGGGPGEPVREMRKSRSLPPLPGRASGGPAATEQVHVHPAVPARNLQSHRLGLLVEAPVARLPVIDAPFMELGQRLQHGASGRGHEERPLREFFGGEFASLPHLARGMNTQVAAVEPVDEDEASRGQRDLAPGPAEERRAHGETLPARTMSRGYRGRAIRRTKIGIIVAEPRRSRPWILGGLILILLGIIVFRLASGYAEGKIAARIERAAISLGARIQYQDLHVGLWPPVRIKGITLEKPGKLTAHIDEVTAAPTFRGPRGFGLLGSVSLGNVRVILPADIEVSLRRTTWEIDPDHSITLKAPVEGLTLTTATGARGRAFDLTATRLSMDALVSFAVEGDASKELGFVDASAHMEGDPRRDFQGTWRFSAFGGDSGGSLIVIPGEKDAKVQFQSSMKGLDFARILRSLGVDAASAPNALGSLSGTISVGGLLHDPATLEVIQRIDFKRPEAAPAEVLRLRGDFSHEVTTSAGSKKSIDVSASSPDFIAVVEIPALFLRTLLIAEDAAFWGHPGIDLTELPRAIAANMARGSAVRGASTITQQLAKNLFLSREKSLKRKLRELSYSFLLESTLGKQRILEIYVNVIEWGPGLYGLRPAARHYFGKEPQALSPREVAFLVSMIPGPVKYQRSIQGGELRRGFETLVNNLLVKMRSVDVISEEEYQAALVETLVFRGPPPPIDEADPPIGQ